jgi:RNA 2',3'-cyclic 3'-phosphodiesterase
VRVFIAVGLPDRVRREAGRRIAAARPRLPAARWTHPDNLHLTLVFLGEVEEAALDALAAASRAAFAAHPPLTLRLAGAGTFPPSPGPGERGRPVRVAWVGLTAAEGLPRLVALQRSAAAAARGVLDLEPERRPWSPHLTLARPKAPWGGDDARAFVAAFAPPLGEPFRAAAGELVRSELGRGPGGGSLYTRVAELPLEAAA